MYPAPLVTGGTFHIAVADRVGHMPRLELRLSEGAARALRAAVEVP